MLAIAIEGLHLLKIWRLPLDKMKNILQVD
jgi:hypothetical protein